MNNDATDTITRLDRLLDAERSALVEGKIDTLPDFLEEKEVLVADLSTGKIQDEQKLARIGEKLRANHSLLEQAISGIRSVAKKLARLKPQQNVIDTYDRSGQRKAVSDVPASGIEKRA